MRLLLDSGLSAQHLLARFAWTIFREFLQRGGSRTVKSRVIEGKQHKEKTEIMVADAINARFFSNRARSQSPRKRKVAEEMHEKQENDGRRDIKRRTYSDSGNSFKESTSGVTDSQSCCGTLGTLQGDEEVNETDKMLLWVKNPSSTCSEGD